MLFLKRKILPVKLWKKLYLFNEKWLYLISISEAPMSDSYIEELAVKMNKAILMTNEKEFESAMEKILSQIKKIEAEKETSNLRSIKKEYDLLWR